MICVISLLSREAHANIPTCGVIYHLPRPLQILQIGSCVSREGHVEPVQNCGHLRQRVAGLETLLNEGN